MSISIGGVAPNTGPLVKMAQGAKNAELSAKVNAAVAKKALDIEKVKGAQIVDMIQKVGSSLDITV